MGIAESKASLRKSTREARKNIDERKRGKAAEALVQRLVNLPAVRHARCIGVYNACGSELSLDPSIEAMRDQNPILTIAYPVLLTDDAMVFVKFSRTDDMTILENPAVHVTNVPRNRILSTEELDIMLVPGVAFDEHGRRLGQGGGHYDRVIPRLKPEAITIGIAFDEQIVDEIPTDPHDRRVNYVLTPSRLITCQ